MKRCALKALLVAALGTLTAPTYAATLEKNAFPRTPVQIVVTPDNQYTVPNDKLLVIETIFAALTCADGATPFAQLQYNTTANEPFGIVIPVTPTGFGNSFVGLHNVRMTVGPGAEVRDSSICVGQGAAGSAINLWGYLLSPASPSLAP